MKLEEAIRTRRSVRRYRADPIPKGMIVRILESACCAPSVSNSQPWRFVVLTGEALERLLKVISRRFAETMREALERGGGVADAAAYSDGPPGLGSETVISFLTCLGGAAVAIVAYMEPEPDERMAGLRRSSVVAAFENLLLAAWGEGLGTCWNSILEMMDQDDVKEQLGIPPDAELIGFTPLGVPAEAPQAPPREPLRNKVVWLGF